MKNGQLQHLKPGEKVILTLFILFIGINLVGVFNYGIASFLLDSDKPYEIMGDLTRIDGIRMMKIANLLSHILAFIVPTILLAKIYNFQPKEFLLINKPKARYLYWFPLIFIMLTLLNQFLYLVNHSIDFSSLSHTLQNDLEYQQAVQEKTIYAYVGATWKSYLVNIFLIAFIPAISEELLFRGLLQHLFCKMAKNMWIGIAISAFFFALIHFQPLNFLPMFALGFCYGLIAAFTGSLLITMLLHFANNALTLSLEHFKVMYNWGDIEIPTIAGIITLVLCTTILVIYAQKQHKTSLWHRTKGVYLR